MFLDGQRQPAKFAEKLQPKFAKVEILSDSLDASVRPTDAHKVVHRHSSEWLV
jgi:hypothetical protein